MVALFTNDNKVFQIEFALLDANLPSSLAL